ncbi:MAG: glycosyltransferase family 2 protein [Candidatus Limivicinus sp.]|jgi:glycosyltransferase involved in cell wall biosynthesis
MKLSVIIPVYMAENYLKECVDSILGQTMKDFEIILINDGSPDGSQKIIDKYVAEYPQKISSLTIDNGGQGRARNFGIDMAKGEYLSFVDSDDYLLPDCFELMCGAADKNSADVVVCDIEKSFDDGRSEYVKSALQDSPLASAGSSSNKIFRRSLVGDIRFPVNVWYEDFSFSAKLLMKSRKTVFVDKALYIYRCGQSSTMHNNNSLKNLDIIKVMQDIHDFAINENCPEDFDFLLINHVLLDSIKRIAAQKSTDRALVLRTLRSYVKKNIPRLSECESFKKESSNRRLIMYLNYHGLVKLSLLILKIKEHI